MGERQAVIGAGTTVRLTSWSARPLMELEGSDRKQFVKEMVQSTNAKGKSWPDYKWSDPVTKKVWPKSACCKKSGAVLVCADVYKRY